MTISPIQPIRGDYVTKGEFSERFDEQKKYMDTGFNKLGEQIDHVEANLGKKIDGLAGRFDGLEVRFDGLESRFDQQKKYSDEGFSKIFKQLDSVEWHLFKRIGDVKADTLLLDVKIDMLSKTVNKIAAALKV